MYEQCDLCQLEHCSKTCGFYIYLKGNNANSIKTNENGQEKITTGGKESLATKSD